jgi:hypothetical protein
MKKPSREEMKQAILDKARKSPEFREVLREKRLARQESKKKE